MTQGQVTSALILAAGRGTRLGPENEGRPKCLAVVGDKTIIDWQLDALSNSGVSHVIIVTGFQAAQIREHLARAGWLQRLKVDFVMNERYASTNVLTSWSLAADSLQDAYVYLHGDTVFEPGFLGRLIAARHLTEPALAVDRHECADEEMKVEVAANRILRISKQLNPSTAMGEFTGIMVVPSDAHRALFSAARTLLSAPNADGLFVEAALQFCIDAGVLSPVMVDVTGMRWREIDFPDDLAAARESLGTPP